MNVPVRIEEVLHKVKLKAIGPNARLLISFSGFTNTLHMYLIIRLIETEEKHDINQA